MPWQLLATNEKKNAWDFFHSVATKNHVLHSLVLIGNQNQHRRSRTSYIMEKRAFQTPSRFPCSNLTFPFTQYTKKSFPDVLCQAKISILLYIPHGCAKSAFYLRPVSKQETRTRKIFGWYDFAIASRSHPQFHKREDEWQRKAWLHFFFLFPFCLLFLLLQLSFQFLN